MTFGEYLKKEFLLTRPSRDVTNDIRFDFVLLFCISTHTSLAGRDRTLLPSSMWYTISTHTSLAGRDV